MAEMVLLHHTPKLQNLPCPHGKTLVRIKYLCLYIITRSIPPSLSISHSIVTPIHEVYTGCLHWCFYHYTVHSSMPHHNNLCPSPGSPIMPLSPVCWRHTRPSPMAFGRPSCPPLAAERTGTNLQPQTTYQESKTTQHCLV